jgi:hypothetical protein
MTARGYRPRTQHQAAAHRGRLLSRVRSISLAITAGAAATALGLGTTFAHALPGHGRPAAVAPVSRPPAGARPAARPAASGPASSGHLGRRARHGHAARRRLAPPSARPTATSAPPQVSSGGS